MGTNQLLLMVVCGFMVPGLDPRQAHIHVRQAHSLVSEVVGCAAPSASESFLGRSAEQRARARTGSKDLGPRWNQRPCKSHTYFNTSRQSGLLQDELVQHENVSLLQKLTQQIHVEGPRFSWTNVRWKRRLFS